MRFIHFFHFNVAFIKLSVVGKWNEIGVSKSNGKWNKLILNWGFSNKKTLKIELILENETGNGMGNEMENEILLNECKLHILSTKS